MGFEGGEASSERGPEAHAKPDPVRRGSHRGVALACVAALACMGALSYAAVPLYRMFCQVTGYAGTTQRAVKAPDKILDRMITVRFDANVAPGMGWTFEPVQRTVNVRIGETSLAFYRATNTTSTAITGAASFNVSPDSAGRYFNKIACFCFTEQTLGPGETIDMPVSFFVDPSIVDSESARSIREITLSYTFYPRADDKAAEVGGQGREPRG